jgi:O-antigen/teichoic acid export membrane protein
LQWPALLVLAILAQPITFILLGHQWLGIAPLVQILALASLSAFTAELNYPVLVSIGAMRDVMLRALIAWPLSGAIVAIASLYGLVAVAKSFLIIVPMQALISIYFVRRHIAFTWTELGLATWRSAVIAVCSTLGPFWVMGWSEPQSNSVAAAFLGILLAVIGWMVALRLTQHPLTSEGQHLLGALCNRARGLRQQFRKMVEHGANKP